MLSGKKSKIPKGLRPPGIFFLVALREKRHHPILQSPTPVLFPYFVQDIHLPDA
jgi:hypothetical protein